MSVVTEFEGILGWLITIGDGHSEPPLGDRAVVLRGARCAARPGKRAASVGAGRSRHAADDLRAHGHRGCGTAQESSGVLVPTARRNPRDARARGPYAGHHALVPDGAAQPKARLTRQPRLHEVARPGEVRGNVVRDDTPRYAAARPRGARSRRTQERWPCRPSAGAGRSARAASGRDHVGAVGARRRGAAEAFDAVVAGELSDGRPGGVEGVEGVEHDTRVGVLRQRLGEPSRNGCCRQHRIRGATQTRHHAPPTPSLRPVGRVGRSRCGRSSSERRPRQRSRACRTRTGRGSVTTCKHLESMENHESW